MVLRLICASSLHCPVSSCCFQKVSVSGRHDLYLLTLRAVLDTSDCISKGHLFLDRLILPWGIPQWEVQYAYAILWFLISASKTTIKTVTRVWFPCCAHTIFIDSVYRIEYNCLFSLHSVAKQTIINISLGKQHEKGNYVDKIKSVPIYLIVCLIFNIWMIITIWENINNDLSLF